MRRLQKNISSFNGILPGLLSCIGIAIVSEILALFVPSLGAATLSIFIGILAGNTFAQSEKLNKGSKFAESTLLSISIVLLGGTLSVWTILELGIPGLSFILAQMAITLFAVIVIGRKMEFSYDFTLLMASGNAVCGSSAIASTASVLHSKSKDKGMAITMVNVTGTVLMILIPLITSFIYNQETLQTSAMIGGVLQSVGQVVASGSMVNEEVTELATIFKIVRIVFLVGVVYILAILKQREALRAAKGMEGDFHEDENRSVPIPWYIIGFFITCSLYSLTWIPEGISLLFKETSHYLEIIALAGIGLRVKFKDLVQQGPRSALYSLWIAIIQVGAAIILIRLLL